MRLHMLACLLLLPACPHTDESSGVSPYGIAGETPKCASDPVSRTPRPGQSEAHTPPGALAPGAHKWKTGDLPPKLERKPLPPL